MTDKNIWDRASEFQRQFINQKAFSLADTGVTHRLITYWDEKGLMIGERDKATWRKFNFEELIWIRMIAKLRQFNVGIETIQEIKDELFRKSSLFDFLHQPAIRNMIEKELSGELDEEQIKHALENPSQKMIEASYKTIFELFLMQVYASQQNISLIIALTPNPANKKKTTIVGMEIYTPELLNDIEKAKQTLEVFNKSFISISLGELVSDSLANINPDKVPEGLTTLSKEEQKIIHLIRSGNYKEITVRFNKKDKPQVVGPDQVKTARVESQVFDIIHKSEYFDIEVKANNGSLHYCKGRKKKKI